ncbi:MAG: hypothetical protein AB7H70_02700 [Rhodospirillaceae bacterium]
MQGPSHAGGTPGNGRAAPQARLFATFKLATPYIEIVQKRTVVGDAKPAANLNRVGLVALDLTPAGFAAAEQSGRPERS